MRLLKAKIEASRLSQARSGFIGIPKGSVRPASSPAAGCLLDISRA
jgi:hypothetical protein